MCRNHELCNTGIFLNQKEYTGIQELNPTRVFLDCIALDRDAADAAETHFLLPVPVWLCVLGETEKDGEI